MPETFDRNPQTPQTAATAAGLGPVIFLIDESAAMDARVAGGTKSKAESIATGLNSLLNQLTAGPAVDVAVVGYRSLGAGQEDIGTRWGGPLAGREFVSTSQLADSPMAIENRVRRIPGAGGVGVAREETVRFPVWYAPKLAGAASRTRALEYCRGLLARWLSAAAASPKPPLILSFVGEFPQEEGLWEALKQVRELATPGGQTSVFHAHLGSSARVPPILYPSGDAHLPPGPIRNLFQACSVLPEPLTGSLKQFGVTLNVGARGLVYNAKMVDLIRFLSLVKAYAQYRPPAVPVGPAPAPTPPATAETPTATGEPGPQPVAEQPTAEQPTTEQPPTEQPPAGQPTPEEPAAEQPAVEQPAAAKPPAEEPAPAAPEAPASPAVEVASTAGEQPAAEETPTVTPEVAAPQAAKKSLDAPGQSALVVLLLDRSVENPSGGEKKSVWRRLQTHANELLAEIAKRGRGTIQTAVVFYGGGEGGRVEVDTSFAGSLSGRTLVRDTDLADGALRVEEVTEQVSNGIGGLVEVTRRKPIFVDLEPTVAAPSPAPAFDAVGQLLADWRKEHPGSQVPPIVLHMTRGRFEPLQIEQATGRLREAGAAASPALLYHLVLTEFPHCSLAYPAEPDRIDGAELRKLWELSSPLLANRQLAARRPTLSAQSRGIVINGKFDLLLDGIEVAMKGPGPESSDSTHG